VGVLISLSKPVLKVRNAEYALKCCIDPTRPTLIAKTEHVYLKNAEKSVRKGTGSVFEEYDEVLKFVARRYGSLENPVFAGTRALGKN